MAFILITNQGIFLSVQEEAELLQIDADLLQIGAQKMSIVVGSFLVKLKTIFMNFEISIFRNIFKDNVQVFS